MKKLGLIIAFIFALAAPAFADPLEGTWKTEVDDGAYAHVKITKCGANLCGHIARTFNSSGEYKSENIGKMLVRNMAPQGDNYYTGKVWRPSNDKIYIGKLTLNGNSLVLKGCVAGGLLCSGQSWKRVN